eukprot:6132736-Pyramimonas_sp.AAC.1
MHPPFRRHSEELCVRLHLGSYEGPRLWVPVSSRVRALRRAHRLDFPPFMNVPEVAGSTFRV